MSEYILPKIHMVELGTDASRQFERFFGIERASGECSIMFEGEPIEVLVLGTGNRSERTYLLGSLRSDGLDRLVKLLKV